MAEIVWSYTAMNDFACPLRGYMKRIAKLKEPEGDPALIGRAAAQAMAHYRSHCLAHGRASDLEEFDSIVRTQAEALEAETPHLIEEFEEIMAATRDSEFLQLSYIGPHYIEALIAIDKTGKKWQLEDPAAGKWAPWGWAWFRVKSDFMWEVAGGNEAAVVEDDKTGHGDPDPLQLVCYAWAASIVFPKAERFTLRFNYLRTGHRDQRTIYRKDLGTMPRELLDRITACTQAYDEVKGYSVPHARAKITPNPDAGHCGYCGFTTGWHDGKGNPVEIGPCPAIVMELTTMDSIVTASSRMPDITDRETAEKATRLVVLVEDVVSKIKDKLKVYVRENGGKGPEAAGKRAEIRPANSIEIPSLSDVVTVLLAQGFTKPEVWSALSLTKTNLDKLLKKRKDVLQCLYADGLIREKTGERFGLYKAKAGEE